jgi:tRNA1(Val) A37 N6-methylase TrmN6
MTKRSSNPRRPEGWIAPGPQPLGDQGDPTLLPGPEEDLSFLAGDWRIFQPRAGHRWSLDDLVTAYVAADAVDDFVPHTIVDLGCGLGSVLMLTAWAFPEARLVGVEAQPSRAARARRSLRYNGADARCSIVDADMRDVEALVAHVGETVDLVTGTPPYFEPGATNLSRDAEAAACRAELRGGLEVYICAAREVLRAGGHLVLCYPASSGERARVAGRAHGLALQRRLSVVPAAGKRPLIVVDRFVKSTDAAPETMRESELVVRDAHGAWTPEFREVRRRFGMPDGSASTRSS